MIVEGKNPIKELLVSGATINKLYVQNNLRDGLSNQIIKLAKEAKIRIDFVSKEFLDRKSEQKRHQGFICDTVEFKYCEIQDILNFAQEKNEAPFIVVLDGIEDPHNFGAILRSADAFGVDGVIIKNRNQVPLNMTVAKVSTGAIEYVKIAQVSNLVLAIKKLKENGFWIYAADGSGKDDYQKLDYSGAVALIVGSEGRGISRLVLDNSDFIVKIPMVGHVNSLNVSVSAGILLSRIANK